MILNIKKAGLNRRIQISQPMKILIFQLHPWNFRLVRHKNIKNNLDQIERLSFPLKIIPQQLTKTMNRVFKLFFLR